MTIQMHKQSILIVGMGNMGSALAEGLMQLKPSPHLIMCDHNSDHHAHLQERFPSATLVTHLDQCETAPNVVIIAVKPKDMKNTCQILASICLKDTLILSIAAGVPCSAMHAWLGQKHSIIRCMPNTPASIGVGMTGLYTYEQTSSEHKSLAQQIMQATGEILWLESEDKIDALTAISGSGPAYVFHLMACLQEAGQSLGFNQDETRLLIQQTVLGAAQLAQGDISFLDLQKNVTSKGGTTESALHVFQQYGLESIVKEALDAAYERAAEISNSFKEK